MDNTKPTLRAPSAPSVHVDSPAPVAAVAPAMVASVATADAPAAPAAPAPAVLQINVNDLAAAIAAALKGVGQSNESTLAAALTAAIDASKPKPKITIANRQRFNPMNPTNRRRKFLRPFYQNFLEVSVDDVTDEEYEFINCPDLKPGMFLNDPRTGPLLEVIDVKRGGQIGLHLRYNNADINQRMQLESKAPNLIGKLALCISEYKAQSTERKRQRAANEDLD